MLSIPYIDIKTGQSLTEVDAEGNLQPRMKALAKPVLRTIAHSYLEHWLHHHSIESSQFWVGKFYGKPEAANVTDQQRLEAEGKHLVFSNGRYGYFADAQTAQLITQGDADRSIAPLFSADRHSPHNHVAYGSLIPSDGITSAALSTARILVIDDENRDSGNSPLRYREGRRIPDKYLEKLYDKMGDGTMLISASLMEQLIQPEEREAIARTVFEQAEVDSSLATSTQENNAIDDLLPVIDRRVNHLIGRTVSQFRAATADLPGLIKGTMSVSEWCDRLGVDAIISQNDIKGDDGRLSEPGIKDISHFWVNRKSDGQYGEQRVGAQVKGCIPEATLHEFNPRQKTAAAELAAVAADPEKLLQHYITQKDQHQRLQIDDADPDETPTPRPPDWLHQVGKADRFGLLTGFNKVNYELERYLRSERVDLAVRGIYVPSAMAQHHSQIKPWEVCNKDLPHGAIVAYYRSPFPNVAAAAIAINNTEILKTQDPEAYRKSGVAYLSPWTAKHIAITDFDKDANGYFVGYLPQVPDLPQQIRQQMAVHAHQPPAVQYEEGRSLFAHLIAEMQTSPDASPIRSGTYPLAVQEFIQRNAPECKPAEIAKQPKVKHPWHENESQSEATWRAWALTADNPVGKVANVGMILQSFAWEAKYCSPDQQTTLLHQISSSYQRLLNSDRLDGNPYWPAIADTLTQIAQSQKELPYIADPQDRQAYLREKLDLTHDLLSAIANGANAENLQTAVDSAKSARGIDTDIHQLCHALAYKEHHLRQHQKNPTIYLHGKPMPTNTAEPSGWAVEQANAYYQESKLPELENQTFRHLLPKTSTPEQEQQAMQMARHYNQQIKAAVKSRDRLNERCPEDEQPTLTVTLPGDGRSLVIQRLCDADSQGIAPIWRANGEYPEWMIRLERNDKGSEAKPEKVMATLVYLDETGIQQEQAIGFVAPQSAQEHGLMRRLDNGKILTIRSPHLRIHAPYALQNEVDEQFSSANQFLQMAIAQIPTEERMAYASALWHHSEGMGIVLRGFTDELCQKLQEVPEITLRGIQRDTNQAGQIPDGEYVVRFSEYRYTSDFSGKENVSPSIAIVQPDGREQQFGAIEDRSVRLPKGSLAKVKIHTLESGKIAKMQVLEKLEESPSVIPEPQSPTIDPALIRGKPMAMVFPLKLHGEENPLPVDTCIEAMRGHGRCHTTRTYEPYKAYGFEEGDLAIARSKEREVVFRVGEQYRITPEMMADPQYQQRWAAMEKHSAKELQTFTTAPQVWGLKMEPVGDWVDRQIVPFSEEPHRLSSQEARTWYTAAAQQQDAAQLQRIMELGKALQSHYNQDCSGDGTLKPPGHYTHASVTLSTAEWRQMRQEVAGVEGAIARRERQVEPAL